MACKSTADVMIKIAEKLKGDADLTSLSTRYFGQGLWVCVGSYGGEEFNPDNAPFVWISPSDDNSPVTLCEDTDASITQFAVNIVIGMCPLRDAPTIDGFHGLAEGLAASVTRITPAERAAVIAAASFGTQQQIDEITERLDDADSEIIVQQALMNSAISGMDRAADAADISAFDSSAEVMTAQATAYATSAGSIKTTALAAAGIATESGHSGADATAVAARVVSRIEDVARNAIALSDRVAAIDAKFAAYVEDPYFREEISSRTASASGVTVFGAVRLIDAFRRAVTHALTANDFGIPLSSMKFANKSTSHYPLDWLEISANFAEPSSF